MLICYEHADCLKPLLSLFSALLVQSSTVDVALQVSVFYTRAVTANHVLYDALRRWYDSQPTLRCAILTGTGRAFCAGADLKEWNGRNAAAAAAASSGQAQQPETS